MSAEVLTQRLERIELLLSSLVERQTVKDFYSTAEVAKIVGRAEYTVREWCRQKHVKARKAPNGRGWLVSHEELSRIRNHEIGPFDPE